MPEKLLLIGNGPSALAKKMGPQIDNYDGTVLRFNSYVTDGFEEFVGSRTDLWWTMADFDAKIAEKKHESRLFIGPQTGESFPDYYLQKNVFGLPYNLEDDAITKKIPYCWRERTEEMMNYGHPTNGATAVLYFLDKEYEIELWGFDFMLTGRPHHYMKDEEIHPRGEQHNGEKEWLFFNRLLESGRIRYFGYMKFENPILLGERVS